MGLCVAMIAFVRLPSLKVSCLLLSGLLIYDVFWVRPGPARFLRLKETTVHSHTASFQHRAKKKLLTRQKARFDFLNKVWIIVSSDILEPFAAGQLYYPYLVWISNSGQQSHLRAAERRRRCLS